MKQTPISISLRRLFAGAAAVGGALLCLPTPAQQQTAPMARVEITGTSIKRLAAQTSLPISSVRAEDFVKQGLTTVQEVLGTIPMNQTLTGSSQSVGSGSGGEAQADLRGLGSNKTLVLLNGRRIASHPYTGETVDLNVIPIAALDRVEILRDGASAIYGTDAIGGVMNFITKRSLTGFGASVEAYVPQHEGGADEQRINAYAGFGDLNRDGWNLSGVVDVHNQSALEATERAFAATGIRPEYGVEQTSGTPFPANFYAPSPGPGIPDVTGNPSYPNCLLQATLMNYLKLYNHHIPQRALDAKTPILALKDWQQKRPELFVKRVYEQTGLDT